MRFRRAEQIKQPVQMLLGIFASHGVLPLEFKPAYSVGDLLLQHLDALDQEAQEKGGVHQVLATRGLREYLIERSIGHNNGTTCALLRWDSHGTRTARPDQPWMSPIVHQTDLRRKFASSEMLPGGWLSSSAASA